MGLELAAQSPEACALIDLAGQACGVDVWRLLRSGGSDWNRTEVIQPLLVAVCLGVWHELGRAGVVARAVAGHSLGEICACCAAGCLDPPAAVSLAAARGRLMAREAAAHPGGMIALLDADEQRAAAAARAAGGSVTVAGCNGPGQWVLSGALPALRSVAASYPSRWLAAAGAWHSEAMVGAVDELRDALEGCMGAPTRARLVCAGTGQVVTRAEQVVDHLARQLVRPFRWDVAHDTLRDLGIEQLVAVGPAKVVRALARRNLGAAVTIHAAERPADLARLVEQVGQ